MNILFRKASNRRFAERIAERDKLLLFSEGSSDGHNSDDNV
jgi:hypothetical protein